MIADFMKIVQEFIGSSTLLRAHGRVGGSATILFLSVPPPEKSAGGFQQAGKKEGGWGEGIFARLLTAPKARLGGGRLRSLSPSRGGKKGRGLGGKNFFPACSPRRGRGWGGSGSALLLRQEKQNKTFFNSF